MEQLLIGDIALKKGRSERNFASTQIPEKQRYHRTAVYGNTGLLIEKNLDPWFLGASSLARGAKPLSSSTHWAFHH